VLFCSSGSEREFALEGSWYADEEIQAGADCDFAAEVEVGLANGKTTPQACKEAEITAQTYYRRRKEFGGLKLDQAKRLKELERENAKLKRLVAELSLEK
jgi:hydroxymethylpyrimidine/phosphomethylpyrimidine kinase